MKLPRFGCYHTSYSSYILLQNSKQIEVTPIIRTGAACFVDFFAQSRSINPKQYKGNIKIDITLSDRLVDKNYNHFCLLNKEEITEWLNLLQALLPITYTTYLKKDDLEIMVVDIDFNNINHFQLKYLCTAVRMIYEHPNAVLLREVFNLKELGLIISSNLMNIYNFLSLFIASLDNHSIAQNHYSLHITYDINTLKELLTKDYKDRLAKFWEANSLPIKIALNRTSFRGLIEQLRDCDDETLISKEATIIRYEQCYKPFFELHKQYFQEHINFKINE